MHQTTIHVRWGEMDPYGHVNHAAYLSYLEHARIGALEGIGWSLEKLRKNGYQVIVARADVRFRRPAAAGDTLAITTGRIQPLAPAGVSRRRPHRPCGDQRGLHRARRAAGAAPGGVPAGAALTAVG